MSSTLAPPPDLKDLQNWFSTAVSRPLSSPTDPGSDAVTFLHSRNGVDGLERISIYNRQYWFRLIDCMHEDFPCAARLLGSTVFNEWVVRHLDRYKSDSPYLADLGRGFYAFLGGEYAGENRDCALEAVRYDNAFNRAFDSPEGAPLSRDGLESARIVLAPHAVPLWLHWDWGSFRRNETAGEEGLAPSLKEHGVLVYRHDHALYEKEISRVACLLLQSLQQPRTLTELFEYLEETASLEALSEAEENLTAWFRDWIELGWLCPTPG